MWKQQILSNIGEDPDKKSGFTEDFYKKKRKKSFDPPVLSGFGEDPD